MSNETSVPQQEMSPAAWLRDFAQRYEAGTLKDVRADVSVPCWGNTSKVPPRLRGRFDFLSGMLTGADKPLHPLMLGYSTPLVEFATPKGGA